MNIHRVSAWVAVLMVSAMAGAMAADITPVPPPAGAAHVPVTKPVARHCLKRSALGRCERWVGSKGATGAVPAGAPRSRSPV